MSRLDGRAITAVLASLLGALLAGAGAAPRAHAQDEVEVYARVVVDRAEVRAGPSATYRRIYAARRDEVFPVRGRASSGYWFRIELPDGTSGFIRGDASGFDSAHMSAIELLGVLCSRTSGRPHCL